MAHLQRNYNIICMRSFPAQNWIPARTLNDLLEETIFDGNIISILTDSTPETLDNNNKKIVSSLHSEYGGVDYFISRQN